MKTFANGRQIIQLNIHPLYATDDDADVLLHYYNLSEKVHRFCSMRCVRVSK